MASKNMLGLGFVFSAMDKGVRSFLRGTSNDFDQMNGAMKGAEKAAGEPGKKGLSGAMSRMGEGLKMMGLGGAVDGLRGLAEKTGDVADSAHGAFKSFESFLAELKFTTGIQGADKLRGKIMSVAGATAASTDELAQASKILLEQGVSVDDVAKGMDRVGNLVGVLGMDAEQVARSMAGWQKQVGGSLSDFEAVTNQAFLLQKEMKIVGFGKEFPAIVEKTLELTNSMKLTQSQAKQLNSGMMKLTAGFSKAGLAPDQAKTAMMEFTDSMMRGRNEFENVRAGISQDLGSLTDLSLVTGNVQKAFNAIKAGDPSSAFTSLGDAIQSVQSQGGDTGILFQNLKKIFGENSQVLSMLFSRYGEVSKGIGQATSALADQGAASVKGAKAIGDLTKATKSTLSFQEKLYEQNKENLGILMKMATSKFAIKIFSAMTKGLKKMMDMFERGWNVIEPVMTNIFETFEPIIAAVFNFVGILSGGIGVVLAVAGALTIFSGALGFATSVFGPLLAGIASFAAGLVTFVLSPIGLVIGAVAGLIALGYAAADETGQVANKITGTWDKAVGFLSDKFQKLSDYLGPKLAAFFDALPAMFDKAVKYFNKGFEIVSRVIEDAVSKMPEVFNRVADMMLRGFQAISGMVGKALDAIPGAISRIAETVLPIFSRLIDMVASAFKKLPSILIPITEKIYSVVISAVVKIFKSLPQIVQVGLQYLFIGIQKALSGIGSLLAAAFSTLPKLVPALISMIAGAVVSVGKGLFDAVRDLMDRAPEIFGSFLSSTSKLLSDLAPKLLSMALNLGVSILDGLKSLWKAIPGIVGMLWNGLVSVTASLIKNLPTLLGKLLGALIKGVVYVIKNIPSYLAAATILVLKAFMLMGEMILDTVTNLPNLLAGLWNGVITVGKALWGGIVGFFSEIWKAVEDVFRSFWNGSISEMLLGWWSSYLEAGKAIWSGLLGFFSDLWSGVSDIFSGAWNSIASATSDAVSSTWGVIENTYAGAKDSTSKFLNWYVGQWSAVGDAFSSAWDSIASATSEAASTTWGFIENTYEGAKDGTSRFLDWYIGRWSAVGDALSKGTKTVVGIVGDSWSSLSDIASETSDSVTGVVSGMWQSMKDSTQEAFASTQGFIGRSMDKALGTAEILSQRANKVIGNLAEYMGGSGLIEGFKDLGNAILDMDFSGLQNSLKKIGDFFKVSDFAKKITEIKNSVVAMIDRLKGTFSFTGFIDSIKGIFNYLKSNPLSEGIKNIINGLVGMSKEFMAKSPLELIRKAFSKLMDFVSKMNFADIFIQISESISKLINTAKDFVGFDALIKGFQNLIEMISKIKIPEKLQGLLDSLGGFADKVGITSLFKKEEYKVPSSPLVLSRDESKPVASASTMGRTVGSGGMKPDKTLGQNSAQPGGGVIPPFVSAPQSETPVNVNVFLKGDIRKIVQEVIVEMKKEAGRGGSVQQLAR
jgi:phage-related protein